MAVHYLFDYGDSSPTTDQPGNSVMHTYGAVGIYTVTVTKKDGDTELASGTCQVAVTEPDEWLRARVTGQGSTFY